MRTYLAAILVVCCATTAYANELVISWEGTTEPVSAGQLAPVKHDGEGYGEKYTFNADFGERGSFYFSIAITNLHPFSDQNLKANGRFTIDGASYRWSKELSESDWKSGATPFFIDAGPARISGTPDRLVFNARVKEGTLEAIMTPIAKAWRPRNGKVFWGRDRAVSDYTVFPLTKTTLKYALGDTSGEVEGRGYGTRTWSDLAPFSQARSTLEFRGISEDSTIYIRELVPAAGYAPERVAYLLITKGNEVLVESFDFKFKPSSVFVDNKHENSYKVAEGFDIFGKSAANADHLFRGRFKKRRLRQRKEPLSKMNPAIRTFARTKTKPVEYDYDTDFLLEVKTPAEIHQIRGMGRYTIYHWNK